MQHTENSSAGRGSLAALVSIGVMGVSSLYLQPLLVGGMIGDRGFSEEQAGFIASADLAGLTVATFTALFWLKRLSWRRMALLGLLVMLVASVTTTFVYLPGPFAAVRFLSGIGAGALLAIAMVAIGQTARPDRNFGIFIAAELLFGTVGLWILPPLTERFGFNSAYWLLAALSALTLLLTRVIPDAHQPATSGAGRMSLPLWLACAGVLASVLLFFSQQNSMWAYIERMGNAAGLTTAYIGGSLGFANLMGLAGAGLVATFGRRFGRVGPLVAATIAQLGCLVALTSGFSESTFVVATAVLAFSWNIVNPFQLAILADVDASGGALALGVNGYTAINVMAGGLAVISLLLMFPALAHLRRVRAAA
jgi:MFS family permease